MIPSPHLQMLKQFRWARTGQLRMKRRAVQLAIDVQARIPKFIPVTPAERAFAKDLDDELLRLNEELR